MFTAEEARQKIYESNSNEIQEQSKQAEVKITEAVLDSKRLVRLDFKAHPKVVEWLRGLGYVVRVYKDVTSVRW